MNYYQVNHSQEPLLMILAEDPVEVAVVTYSVPHLSSAGAFLETVLDYQCRGLVMGKRLDQGLL